MAGLKDTTIATGYRSLVRINDNTGVGSSPVQCTDGDGVNIPISIGKRLVVVQPTITDGNAFEVKEESGSDTMFRVNTNTPYVTALGHYVNTQYAHFGVHNTDSASYAVNTHQAIPFNGIGIGDVSYPPEFGTGTDPETTFTTADSNNHRASDLVPCLWFVKDNITIDDIDCFVGSDHATADTATRIHLFQYTFNSGSTSALTSGSVIAHSTSDTNNAGSEQIYKTTLTKDVTDIAAGQVIVATYRSDSVNGDFSISINCKYRLR